MTRANRLTLELCFFAAGFIWTYAIAVMKVRTTISQRSRWFFALVVPVLAILLFGCTAHAQSKLLTWTTPGDPKQNNALVPVVAYELRLDTIAFDTTNCLNAPVWPITKTPKIPKALDSFLVTGLIGDRWYWAQLRARDSAGNWANCGNTATWRTPDTKQPETIKDLTPR